MEEIEIVCATRHNEERFWNSSALGCSLRRYGFPNDDCGFSLSVYLGNSQGLPKLYNEVIDSSTSPDILVFIHDDVWIDDIFFLHHINEGLKNADIIGVVGNTRRLPRQRIWAYAAADMSEPDVPFLSGSIAHGQQPYSSLISRYGPTGKECELLDGVFLAARASVLRNAGVRFDEQFDFHFYDMDFCRQARAKGLRILTWPICLTHQSGGSVDSHSWEANYRRYLAKWLD